MTYRRKLIGFETESHLLRSVFDRTSESLRFSRFSIVCVLIWREKKVIFVVKKVRKMTKIQTENQ